MLTWYGLRPTFMHEVGRLTQTLRALAMVIPLLTVHQERKSATALCRRLWVFRTG